jgi:hypothetical protein
MLIANNTEKGLSNGVNATFNPTPLKIESKKIGKSALSLYPPESLPQKSYSFTVQANVIVDFLKNFPVAHNSTHASFTIVVNNSRPTNN